MSDSGTRNSYSFSRSTSPSGSIQIRSAVAADLPAATQCCLAAFTRFEVFGPPWNSDAGVLPALLQALPDIRMRLAIDSTDESVVGLAVWGRRQMHIGGRLVSAAFLAPLAVVPQWHGHGAGAALMRDGIEMLRQDQVELLYILGHEAYYPRFGLLPGCLGRHTASVLTPSPLLDDPEGYRLRPLQLGDEAVCMCLWQALCAEADGAVEPDAGLLPWASKTRGIIAAVLERNGDAVAYARFDTRQEAHAGNGVLRFLAADAESARILAGRILGWTGWQCERLVLPLPSRSAQVRSLFPDGDLIADEQWWPPGMAMSLGNAEINQLLRQIQAKEAPPLFVEWPALFDY